MAKLTKLASLTVKALEDLKGLDIQVLDVAKHTSITDWWIICTGTSNRHVRSLAEYVVTKAKAAGEIPRGIQGLEKSEWVLVDLNSVVVHVLQAQTRAHYQLEKLMPETPVPTTRAAAPAGRRAAPRKTAKAKKAAPRRAAGPKKAGKPRKK